MSEEQSPSPSARDRDQSRNPSARDGEQSVAAFLDVFADWLASDARPAITARTMRLRELAPALEDVREIGEVVARLDRLLVHLEALGVAIADRTPAHDVGAVEALADAAADRCEEARTLLARTRTLLADRTDARGATPDARCRLHPE